jgi:hypothetical protein
MTMKFKIHAAAITAVLILLSVSSFTRAQCPDSTGPAPNPSTNPWTSDSIYTQIGSSECFVWVYFCRRDIPGDTTQVWISQIVEDTNSICDTVAYTTLIADARYAVYTSAGVNHGYVCIKNGQRIVETFVALCWDEQPYQIGLSLSLNPCGSNAYCYQVCKLCYSGTPPVLQITDCSSVETYGMSDHCPINAPDGRDWVESLCYYIRCLPPGTKADHSGITTSPIVNRLVTLAPNPAKDEVECAWPGNAHAIEIVDVLGNIVHSYTLSPSTESIRIPLKGLPPGSYYVRIVFVDGGVQTYPLSKSDH